MELSVKSLTSLCEEQGWTIQHTGKDRLKLLSPDGTSTVIMAKDAAYRDLQNTRSHLRHAGLVFPSNPKEEHAMATARRTPQLEIVPDPEPDPEPVTGEAPARSDTDEVLDLALQMIDELTNTYKDFAKSTIATITEFRGLFQSLTARIDNVDKIAKAAVQSEQLAQAVKELKADSKRAEEAAARAAAAADPIAAFRKRLQS